MERFWCYAIGFCIAVLLVFAFTIVKDVVEKRREKQKRMMTRIAEDVYNERSKGIAKYVRDLTVGLIDHKLAEKEGSMRAIDAIKYGENLVWLIGHGEFSSPQDALRRALYDLAQTPTLTLDDLRPKGRWVNWGKSGTPTYENYGTCSVCHEDAEIHTEHRNFCPSCGADMRGGGEDG